MKPTQLPSRPWQKIGLDTFFYEGKNYLIIVDYFSRWIEMPRLKDISSAEVIEKLKDQFARWGVPEEIRSDGGTQFTSKEFQVLCKEYDMDHTTSAPHHHQGNGAAERAVQTAKRILKQKDPSLALMNYRATPIAVTGYSPAQLIMGRNLNTRLPTLSSNLNPEWPDLELVKKNDAKAKERNATNYNRTHGAKSLPPLKTGSTVRVRLENDKQWSKPMEIRRQISSRNYDVINISNIMQSSGNQKALVRTRRYIRDCPIIEEMSNKRKSINMDNDARNVIVNTGNESETQGKHTRSGRLIRPVERYQAS